MSDGRSFRVIVFAAHAARLAVVAGLAGCVGDIASVSQPEPASMVGSPMPASPSPSAPVTPLVPASADEPAGATAARVRSAAPRWARLGAEQVRATIADLFGDVAVGPLDPDLRVEGFASIGGAAIATSEQGVERYTNMAFAVAAQVMQDPARRGRWVTCTPTAAATRACAEQAFARLGRALFRRPLEPETLAGIADLTATVASETGDPWVGFEHALAAMLQSPRFLYVLETPASPLAAGGSSRLDAYSLATRLSLLMAGGNPDEALLDAAAGGGLDTTAGMLAQVRRLSRTPRFRSAVRSLFAAMWDIEQVKTRPFDPSVPGATATIGASMFQETMRFLEHHLIDGAGDYRAALTSNVTFLNAELAALYGVTMPKTAGADGFAMVTLPATSRRHGLFTQGALLAATSSPKDSSPILRGRMIQEDFLCRPIPPPPPDLMASLPPASKPATKRDRLAAHRQSPGCNACHAALDPPGLALENYGPLGAHRATENGLTIDASGTLDGVAWKDAGAFAAALAAHPSVTACLVAKVLRHATGRVGGDGEGEEVARLTAAFDGAGRKLVPLLESIVASDAFTHVSLPSN